MWQYVRVYFMLNKRVVEIICHIESKFQKVCTNIRSDIADKKFSNTYLTNDFEL